MRFDFVSDTSSHRRGAHARHPRRSEAEHLLQFRMTLMRLALRLSRAAAARIPADVRSAWLGKSDVHPCPLLSVTYAMVAGGSSYDLDADAKQRVVPRSEAPLCCSRIRHRTRGSDRAAGKLDRQPCPRHRATRRQDTRRLDPARLPSHGAGRQLRGGTVHEILEGFRFGADSRAHSSGRSVARKHHARWRVIGPGRRQCQARPSAFCLPAGLGRASSGAAAVWLPAVMNIGLSINSQRFV